jgi:FAD/FMN-containing dehydrogenase
MGVVNALKNPASCVAKEIEGLVIKGQNSKNSAVKLICSVGSRAMSLTLFPLALYTELFFKRIPKLLLSMPCHSEKDAEKFNKNLDKVAKFGLGILCSPLGLRSADGVSGLFLKAQDTSRAVRPFGVEQQYGREVEKIHYPATIEEVLQLVRRAKAEKKQISIIGAGMSQGKQTVPASDAHMVIDTRGLNKIEIDGNTAKVQAGATWEMVQYAADKQAKSVIVKQASDLFSIGGSIAINCHGWAHEYGAIASTVESLEVIDANGDIRTLTPDDELFGCFFGTLGYFGVIVGATLKLENNEMLYENTVPVELDQFIEHYKTKVKGQGVPLFGGRLVLDTMEDDPLRQVYMVTYTRETPAAEANAPAALAKFEMEPKYGTRFQRIALQAIGHLSYFTTRRLLSNLWSKEKEQMLTPKRMTRNEALHPPINAFMFLRRSNLHTQWLQEYFISEERLPNFLRFLGAELKANEVRLINATIRPTPQDNKSILPYAKKDSYAVVICFSQLKTERELERAKQWISRVNDYVVSQGDLYYQAYMPFASREQFEKCYGKEQVEKLRTLKEKYDPDILFNNGHTNKYYTR